MCSVDDMNILAKGESENLRWVDIDRNLEMLGRRLAAVEVIPLSYATRLYELTKVSYSQDSFNPVPLKAIWCKLEDVAALQEDSTVMASYTLHTYVPKPGAESRRFQFVSVPVIITREAEHFYHVSYVFKSARED